MDVGDPKKRMLVAVWASEARAEFCKDNQHCIESAFVRTGSLIDKDGSAENGLISPEIVGSHSARIMTHTAFLELPNICYSCIINLYWLFPLELWL